MRIISIVGATTADEDAAVRLLVHAIKAGSYPADLADRLPRGRVEVLVASDASAHTRPDAVIVIEGGEFSFQPLGRPQ